MKQVIINLYSFNELNNDAKYLAISEHGDFMESVGIEYENEHGEIETDYNRPEDCDIIDSIEANDYLFYENGKLARCVKYVGNHPKSGITEFTIEGSTYQVN